MIKEEIALVDVDTQNDFLDPKGTLYIKGSDCIRQNLKKLTDFAVKNNITLISTMDSHKPDDPEFYNFNPHCITGTWGWKKIPETTISDYLTIEPQHTEHFDLQSNRFIIKKPRINAFSNPNTVELIKALRKSTFIVYGVATEYCVKEIVLGVLDEGLSVYLVEDAIRGIDLINAEKAIDEMLAKGAELIKTDEVLKIY